MPLTDCWRSQLRPGGVLLLHDVLLPEGADDTSELAKFHEKLRVDEGRLPAVCTLAIGVQGLLAVVKSLHRPPPDVSRPHALCVSCQEQKTCAHGARCNFAHSAVELTAWQQAAERAVATVQAVKMSSRGGPKAQSKSHSQGAAAHATLLKLSIRPQPQLSALVDRTARLGKAAEYASPVDTVALLQLLVWATGAARVLEVGVFTGVATLGMALALTAAAGQRGDNRIGIVGCELEPKWPAIGQPYWAAAHAAHFIDIKLGDAVKTLDKLTEKGSASEQGQCSITLAEPDGVCAGLAEELSGAEWVQRSVPLNGTASCNVNANFLGNLFLKMQNEWRIDPEKR